MPDMNPRELGVFNMLLQHADRIANSPPMNDAQVQTILLQVQADAAKMQLDREKLVEQFGKPDTAGAKSIVDRRGAAIRAANAIAQYVGG